MAKKPEHKQQKQYCNEFNKDFEILKKEENKEKKSCQFAKYLNCSLPMPHQDSTAASLWEEENFPSCNQVFITINSMIFLHEYPENEGL